MNNELDIKIKNLQEKVNKIREKTTTLQEITKENLQKTKNNINNLVQLTESVESIMGDPEVTKIINDKISKFSQEDYSNIIKNKSKDNLIEKIINNKDYSK